jgi:hypothetical protein
MAPGEGLEIKGNVPPAFQQAMAQDKKRAEQEIAQQTQAPMPTVAPNTGAALATNPQFEAIIGKLGTKWETISLPSRGKFYTDDHLKSGVLHVRKMTGADEEYLASPRLVKRNEAMDKIFQACIQEPVDTTQLLTIDRTYLLIWLRGISYGSNYDVEVKCTECETKFQTSINLDELEVEYCPDDFGMHSLEGVLPDSGFKFKYRLSYGNDETTVTHHRERRLKMFGDSAVDDTLTFRAALLLNDIEGITSHEELSVILKRLGVEDINYLRNLVNEPPFGVDTECTIYCPNCSADFNQDLPLEAGFFFPRSQKKEREK